MHTEFRNDPRNPCWGGTLVGLQPVFIINQEIHYKANCTISYTSQHMNEPPPPIPNISSDLQIVIDRALAKDSFIRYNSAKEMVDEFIAVFNGQTVSLNTISYTKMAKASAKPKTSLFSTALAGVSIFVILLLAFIAFRPTALSPASTDNPIGKTTFLDFNAVLDKATITFNGLPVLEAGTHYDVWALGLGGESRRNLGTLEMTSDTSGELIYIASDQNNILSLFD